MQHWAWGIAAFAVPVSIGTMCSSETPPNVTFENHHWAQRAPKDPRDMVNWFSVVDQDDLRYGAAQRRSAWRWIGETFLWRRDADKVTLSFPQSNRKLTFTAKAYACKQGPFDRCLDLTWKGRTITLYSMEDLRIRGKDAVTPFQPGPPIDVDPIDAECASCVEGTPETWMRLFREADAGG